MEVFQKTHVNQPVYLAQSDGTRDYLGQVYELTNEYLAIVYHDFIICYYRLDEIAWQSKPSIRKSLSCRRRSRRNVKIG